MDGIPAVLSRSATVTNCAMFTSRFAVATDPLAVPASTIVSSIRRLTRSPARLGLLLVAGLIITACDSGSVSEIEDLPFLAECSVSVHTPDTVTDCAEEPQSESTVEEHSRSKKTTAERRALIRELRETLAASNDGTGASEYQLPNPNVFWKIPQDPENRLTRPKIRLGAFLFHETSLATDGESPDHAGQWSCASCHHVAAGFKSGVVQGIGEGGSGFGERGEGRTFDQAFLNAGHGPDVQPVSSPTALNTAFQSVMLWNGQFGNGSVDNVNAGIDSDKLTTEGTPKASNLLGLAGLETQAHAGLTVHRLGVVDTTVLQTNRRYRGLYRRAFPNGGDVHVNAAKAIAAYERILLSHKAPFQKFLRGNNRAMTMEEMRGAVLFFGDKAGCADCHRGPALSSRQGASEHEMFMAIGFGDLDSRADQQHAVHGVVKQADRLGRGGFTGEEEDMYRFKIPQLYNLADSDVFGHGGTFRSIREVVEYKNTGVAQNPSVGDYIDPRFRELNLSDDEVDSLVAFLEGALYDPLLKRYVPRRMATGACFPVADLVSFVELGCR